MASVILEGHIKGLFTQKKKMEIRPMFLVLVIYATKGLNAVCKNVSKILLFFPFLYLELSEVLWEMVFKNALKITGVLGIAAVFVIFTVWAGTHNILLFLLN